MIGKAERGKVGIDAIKKHKAVYLMAVGGAAYLVSKAIRKSRIVAFEDLGMEAIHEFEVEEMPVNRGRRCEWYIGAPDRPCILEEEDRRRACS